MSFFENPEAKIFRPKGKEMTRIGCTNCGGGAWIWDYEGIVVPKELMENILFHLNFDDEPRTKEVRRQIMELLE